MSPAFQFGSPAGLGAESTPKQPLSFPVATEEMAADVIDTASDDVGLRLVTAHADGSIKLWESSGKEEWAVRAQFKTRHAKGALRSVRFAPSRLSPAIVATVGADGLAVVYRLSEEEQEPSISSEGLVIAHEAALRDASDALTGIAFSDNGMLATVGDEHVLRLYQSPDNGEKWGLMAAVDVGQEGQAAGGVSFSPGGAFCVACGDIVTRTRSDWEWEVCARIGDDVDGENENMDNDESVVTCADWGAAGFIGVGRSDGSVEVWRMHKSSLSRAAKMSEQVPSESSKVVQIEWDRAGGVLATGHADRGLRTWARIPSGELGSWTWMLRDSLKL